MSARTYKGRSLPAALNLVRRELGEEAVIVSVTEGAAGVEVVAVGSRSRKGMRQLFERVRAVKAQAQRVDVAVGAEDVTMGRGEPDGGGLDNLDQLEPIEDGSVPATERTGHPELRVVGSKRQPASPIALALDSMDLPPDLAARVASTAGQGPLGWERVLSWLERGWPIPEPPVSDPSKPQALAFGRGRVLSAAAGARPMGLAPGPCCAFWF